MSWRSLSALFGYGRKSALQRELRLTEAYQAVFRGSPTNEDQELVLADLAVQSGFYTTAPENMAGEFLQRREGRRDTFAAIYSRLTLSDGDVEALRVAARHEHASMSV